MRAKSIIYEKTCINCLNNFSSRFKDQASCSRECASLIKSKLLYDKYIKEWKKGEVSGGRGDASGHGYVSHHIRKYLFQKYNNKCAKCDWGEVNTFTNTIPLEVEHIDGNSLNHKEDNLILLCPNCHSLTPGHSTSKGNGRRYYREQYHKNKNL